MHRKLRLNENIRRRSLPRYTRSERPTVLPVIVKLSRSYAAGAVIVARPEEAGAVDVI